MLQRYTLKTEDLHFLRSARKEAYKQDQKLTLNLLMNDLAKRELASIYRSDLTLIISKFEFKLLKKRSKLINRFYSTFLFY